MKNILIPKDYEYLVGLVDELKAESKTLAKKLGAAAAYGGSFQIPEYQSIEDRLRVIEARVVRIKKVLVDAHVVPFDKMDNKRIGFYTFIETENLETGAQENFYLIHPELIDKTEFKDNILPVSPESPVGQALMDKKMGEIAKIKLPKTIKKLKIISFEKKEY